MQKQSPTLLFGNRSTKILHGRQPRVKVMKAQNHTSWVLGCTVYLGTSAPGWTAAFQAVLSGYIRMYWQWKIQMKRKRSSIDSTYLVTNTASSWDVWKKGVWVVALRYFIHADKTRGWIHSMALRFPLLTKLAKAFYLDGKKRGAASRYLRRGSFSGGQLGTLSQRIGKEMGISHTDWLQESASDWWSYAHLHRFLLSLQECIRRDTPAEEMQGLGGTVRLSPTCRRNPWSENLNCWVNSHCLQTTSIYRCGSILQRFVFTLEMFLVMQFNVYDRFSNLRWM